MPPSEGPQTTCPPGRVGEKATPRGGEESVPGASPRVSLLATREQTRVPKPSLIVSRPSGGAAGTRRTSWPGRQAPCPPGRPPQSVPSCTGKAAGHGRAQGGPCARRGSVEGQEVQPEPRRACRRVPPWESVPPRMPGDTRGTQRGRVRGSAPPRSPPGPGHCGGTVALSEMSPEAG